MTPEQRALRGRLGAAVLHSRYDSRYLTQAARRKFSERFINEVLALPMQPSHVLSVPPHARRFVPTGS